MYAVLGNCGAFLNPLMKLASVRCCAAVQPDVQPIGLCRIVPVRDRDAHGLHGAVELGVVAENLAPFLDHPGRLSFLQLVPALDSLIEHRERNS